MWARPADGSTPHSPSGFFILCQCLLPFCSSKPAFSDHLQSLNRTPRRSAASRFTHWEFLYSFEAYGPKQTPQQIDRPKPSDKFVSSNLFVRKSEHASRHARVEHRRDTKPSQGSFNKTLLFVDGGKIHTFQEYSLQKKTVFNKTSDVKTEMFREFQRVPAGIECAKMPTFNNISSPYMHGTKAENELLMQKSDREPGRSEGTKTPQNSLCSIQPMESQLCGARRASFVHHTVLKVLLSKREQLLPEPCQRSASNFRVQETGSKIQLLLHPHNLRSYLAAASCLLPSKLQKTSCPALLL